MAGVRSGAGAPYSSGLEGDGLETLVEAVGENDGLEDLLCRFDFFFWWHAELYSASLIS